MRQHAGRLKIPRNFLTQICFGLRTSRAGKDLITGIVRANCSKMNYCQIVMENSDFGLEAIDL
jgi:hypothetical protein